MYFDGLGRQIQEIHVAGSPTLKDIIKPIVYDDLGRTKQDYLPYAYDQMGLITPGAYRITSIDEQKNFYQTYYEEDPNYTFAEKGFELNNYYSRYLLTADDKEYSYEQFLLRERYNSYNKPEFKLEQLSTTATTTEDFKVNIVAKNVADFAKLYDVRFMKLGLNFEGLKLKDVVFSDFMDGLKDVSTYTYTPDSTTAILYKGLVLEGDETEEATENFATLVFEVTDTESATVTLSYEGWWDSYEAYSDTPNPVFKDKYNANVDGFVIDHTPLSVVVGGEE